MILDSGDVQDAALLRFPDRAGLRALTEVLGQREGWHGAA
jgi:hypothetical protein